MIQFEDTLQVQRSADVVAPVRKRVQVINRWLDSRSDFYSRLLGEPISWRKALRIGVVLPLLLIAVAVCGVQAPLATVTSVASAGYVVYKLNASEEGGMS